MMATDLDRRADAALQHGLPDVAERLSQKAQELRELAGELARPVRKDWLCSPVAEAVLVLRAHAMGPGRPENRTASQQAIRDALFRAADFDRRSEIQGAIGNEQAALHLGALASAIRSGVSQ